MKLFTCELDSRFLSLFIFIKFFLIIAFRLPISRKLNKFILSIMSNQKYAILRNGNKMPFVGLGTWKVNK